MKDSARRAMYAKLNNVPKSYYERHFTNSELVNIADGSPNASEVYLHTFQTTHVTPHQAKTANIILKERGLSKCRFGCITNNKLKNGMCDNCHHNSLSKKY